MQRTRFVGLLLVLLALAFVDPASAAPQLLTVTDCGDTTPGGAPGQLRYLINQAAPGDTIIVPACLIILTGAANEDVNQTGDLDITKTLTIQGAGSHATVIDGGLNDRVFDVQNFAPLPLPGVVTISDLMIRRGFGQQRGGGIRNLGNLVLNRVVVRDNLVGGGIEAGGAGIGNQGTIDATEIAVEANSATGPVLQQGGGIYNTGTFNLTRSTVSNNKVLPDQAFSNTGGVVNSGTMGIFNSTVSGNNGGQDGPGGIFNTGNLTMHQSVVAQNFSPSTDNGIRNTGIATLTNTIVADNAQAECSGVITSGGGNFATDATCNLIGPNDAVSAGSGMGPLSTHGGPTNTHALLPGSPAIDTALGGASCPPTDQRGVDRPLDGNGDTVAACDKGSFEFFPPIFADVPANHIARGAIEAMRVNGITSGCGSNPLIYCPDDPITRAELSVFILRTLHGSAFVPPPAVGIFLDVPVNNVFAPWIEQLFNEGITTGCGPSLFCPDGLVSRTQLSILILRALTVVGFVPPAATGVFIDVPADHPTAPFIEEFFHRGVTTGCQADPLAFCPGNPATRGQIAIFLVRSFSFGF